MKDKKPKFIFVTGGVLSGLGKGITAASIGALMQASGAKISIQKCDPYLNVDAGTLNPAEHGECFVTKDGAETDLDLGHYERFLDIELTQSSSTMSGRLLRELIEDERAGKFLGKTVQLVPHFTNTIQKSIIDAANEAKSDIHIVEVGGTVGDIEGQAFIEAIREFSTSFGRQNCLFVHLVYVPYLGASKEFKTKPAQNAVRDLRAMGIMPDILLARSEDMPPEGIIEKLSLFSGLPVEAVVSLPNANTVYQVPLVLEENKINQLISKRFGIKSSKPDMTKWHEITKSAQDNHQKSVTIGIVAKYLDNQDTYFSVVEALKSAAWHNDVNLSIEWIDAEDLSIQNATKKLNHLDGILVPGGFGSRGIEGKIAAARYCMDNNVPYLGICLGLQVAVVAAVRKSGLQEAASTEWQPEAKIDAIYTMTDQQDKLGTGGTMRLGDYACVLEEGSRAAKIYGSTTIIERHRHRYEVNQKYKENIESVGIKISGLSPDGQLVEMVELTSNKFFVATQAHPEFKSRPNRPHPLFDGFIKSTK